METPDTKTIPDEIRAKLVTSVNASWDEIIASLVELATGVWLMEDVYENGALKEHKVFKKAPDKEVAFYLTNQVIGKPKESMNIEGKVVLKMDDSLAV
jgi:hypothetical protein